MFKYKIYNSMFNTFPYIVHNPDISNNSSELWDRCLKNKPIIFSTIPDELSIITFNSKNEKGLLEQQLDSLDIKYHTLGKGIKWDTQKNKIKLINSFIDNIKTKYLLVCDCYDVVVVRDLRTILEDFKLLQKDRKLKLLFNATVYCHPNYPKQKCKEESLNLGLFQYLNSGVYIGETDYIKSFFSNIDLTKQLHQYDDQCYVKEDYFKNLREVNIDNNCNLFQVIFDLHYVMKNVHLIPKIELS